ncbi:MAG: flagellar basal body L-ring protein FlgH [bacterium]|nr:flagellar basal body L-ring protein FlgH [bacterium]
MTYSSIPPFKLLMVLTLLALTSACTPRLGYIGKEPPLTHITNPIAQPNYQPVTMPMPSPSMPSQGPQVQIRKTNSLWQSGARAFFKDQRASRVGDIVTVTVAVKDTVKISNDSKRSRQTAEKVAVDNFMGIENNLSNFLPTGVDPGKLIGISSNPTHAGKGSIDRTDEVSTKIAATITQVLPNGNLVIWGRQEMRVNFEVRDLTVMGIVRPSDIAADNTIDYLKIAEARLSYGGRGHISEMQQPPYGQQILNIISPF